MARGNIAFPFRAKSYENGRRNEHYSGSRWLVVENFKKEKELIESKVAILNATGFKRKKYKAEK